MTFKEKVLAVVRNIPRGNILSYQEVAFLAGNHRASRIVGTIMSGNHDKSVPCHRVVKSGYHLGGYNGGVAKKMRLLHEEGAIDKILRKVTTLCFLYTEEKILLALKKRGFGKDWWNGFGGKVKKEESLESAAIREIYEESMLSVSGLKKRGRLFFQIDSESSLLDVNIFQITNYTGAPMETEEMLPRWFSLNRIPYNKMWSDDRYWLPKFLAGKNINGYFHFKNNNDMLDFIIDEVPGE